MTTNFTPRNAKGQFIKAKKKKRVLLQSKINSGMVPEVGTEIYNRCKEYECRITDLNGKVAQLEVGRKIDQDYMERQKQSIPYRAVLWATAGVLVGMILEMIIKL